MNYNSSTPTSKDSAEVPYFPDKVLVSESVLNCRLRNNEPVPVSSTSVAEASSPVAVVSLPSSTSHTESSSSNTTVSSSSFASEAPNGTVPTDPVVKQEEEDETPGAMLPSTKRTYLETYVELLSVDGSTLVIMPRTDLKHYSSTKPDDGNFCEFRAALDGTVVYLPREEDPEVEVQDEAASTSDANVLTSTREANSSGSKRSSQSIKKQSNHITGSNKKARTCFDTHNQDSSGGTEDNNSANGNEHQGTGAANGTEGGGSVGRGRNAGRCRHCGYLKSKCRNGIHGDYAFVGGIVLLTDKIVEDGECPPWEVIKARFEGKLSEMLHCETKLVTGKYDDKLLPFVPKCVKIGTFARLRNLYDSVHKVFDIRDRKSHGGATFERLRKARQN